MASLSVWSEVSGSAVALERAAERSLTAAGASSPPADQAAVRLGHRLVVVLADDALRPGRLADVAVGDHLVEGVDRRLGVRVAAGDPRRRARAALLELADVPVLAVGQVPEGDRVGRVEAGLGHRRRPRTASRTRRSCGPARPARAGGRAGSRGGSTGRSSARRRSSRRSARRAGVMPAIGGRPLSALASPSAAASDIVSAPSASSIQPPCHAPFGSKSPPRSYGVSLLSCGWTPGQW